MTGRPRDALKNELIGRQLVSLVAGGATLHQASQQLELNWEKARGLYHRALEGVADQETKEQVLQQDLVTLQRLQLAMMGKAIKGDVQAANTVLKIIAQRSRLVGTEQAQQVNLTISAVNEGVREISEVLEGEVVDALPPLRRIQAAS